MKRLLMVALTLAVAAVAAAASVASAGTAGAQTPPRLEMTLSPEVAPPGAAVTAASVEPCPGDVPWNFGWEVRDLHHGDLVDSGGADVVDGHWHVTFPAPEEPTDYQFSGWCAVEESGPQYLFTASFSVEGDGPAELEMALSPAVAAPGEEVIAESVEPCPGDDPWVFGWEVRSLSHGDQIDGGADMVDGHWQVAFPAPQDDGDYEFSAWCQVEEGTPEYAYSAQFAVDTDDSSPPGGTEPPAPASPVQAQPRYTG
jgi:hypothetical protein